ncbi:protein YgfX [Undibacterium flavidum]|uniref:Toxin CptA n=1 Tax=Undibacterium flavidum TaxID=2762297 RepID=A0ABR6YCL3_9BURK|nr:protein YgfX [Undibacterium flavidum]MBC3874289.1 hypothetical protein [Undibacterium flavidum]
MNLAVSMFVKSSQRLKLYLLVVSVLVFCALSYVAMVLYEEVGIYGLLVMAAGLFFIACLVRRQLVDTVPYQLEIDSDGNMAVRDMRPSLNEQSFRAMSVRSPIVVWSQLIVMRVQDETGMQRRLLIFRDAVSINEFRRLSVALTYLSQRRQRSLIDGNQMSEGNF